MRQVGRRNDLCNSPRRRDAAARRVALSGARHAAIHLPRAVHRGGAPPRARVLLPVRRRAPRQAAGHRRPLVTGRQRRDADDADGHAAPLVPRLRRASPCGGHRARHRVRRHRRRRRRSRRRRRHRRRGRCRRGGGAARRGGEPAQPEQDLPARRRDQGGLRARVAVARHVRGRGDGAPSSAPSLPGASTRPFGYSCPSIPSTGR